MAEKEEIKYKVSYNQETGYLENTWIEGYNLYIPENSIYVSEEEFKEVMNNININKKVKDGVLCDYDESDLLQLKKNEYINYLKEKRDDAIIKKYGTEWLASKIYNWFITDYGDINGGFGWDYMMIKNNYDACMDLINNSLTLEDLENQKQDIDMYIDEMYDGLV